MKAQEFVKQLLQIVSLKTTYLMGGFGCRLGLDWYSESYAWNAEHAAELNLLKNTDPITFGFDCVCLLKAVLFFGFEGDPNKEFGGSVYRADRDFTIQTMLDSCPDLTDKRWDEIEPGEFVWMNGHIGAYVGNGLCVEATPSWKSGVQLSALGNIGNVNGYPTRTWTKHGHSRFLEFDTVDWQKEYSALLDQYTALEKTRTAEKEAVQKTIDGLTRENTALTREVKEKSEALQIALRTHEEALSELNDKLLEEEEKTAVAQAEAKSAASEAQAAKQEVEKTKADFQGLIQFLQEENKKLEVKVEELEKELSSSGDGDTSDTEENYRKQVLDLKVQLEVNKKKYEETISLKEEIIANLKANTGDINGDGKVTFADVIELLLMVLKKKPNN